MPVAVEIPKEKWTGKVREVTLGATATGVGIGANLGIREDFFVEALRGEITREGVHRMSYQLSPARVTGGGFWVLGSALLGTDTKLAY